AQSCENSVGLLGGPVVTGIERDIVRMDAGLKTQPHCLAYYLAVPLHKAERGLGRILFHRRMRAQHQVLKIYPAPAFTGLTVRQPPQIRAEFAGHMSENLLAIGQRHAADQMNPVGLLGHFSPRPALFTDGTMTGSAELRQG